MTAYIKIVKKQNYEKENGKPDQEEVWNSIAKAWNRYVVKKIPAVQEFLFDKKGKIIDLGCGDGRNMIPSSDIEYFGVDFSEASLKHALNRSKKEKINVKLFKFSADKLPDKFKKEMFDYGLFIATLHCLETPEKRKNSLKEFYRVLKKNSEALISVWNSEDKRFKCVGNHGDIYMSWLDNGKPNMRYYYLFSKQEFTGLLEECGFKILEFYSAREHDRFSKKNWIVRVRKT